MSERCLFLYTLKDKSEIELLSALTLWFIVNSKKTKKMSVEMLDSKYITLSTANSSDYL